MTTTYLTSDVVCYAAAILVNIWARGALAVRDQHSGIGSMRQYFTVNLAAAIWRTLFATAYFIWWLHDPQLVSKWFDWVGSFFSGATKAFLESMEFPLNPGTAILYGLGFDTAFDKVLKYFGIEKSVPPLAGGI